MSKKAALWLSASVGLFLILAINRLEAASMWHDETFSFMLAQYDLSELLRRAQFDVHPPLYYVLLKGWMSLFGASVFALRIMSVIAGALTIIALQRLLTVIKQPKLALIAPALLAINPFWLRYAQEVRMYTLAGLLITLTTLLLVRYEQSKQQRYLVGYSLLAGLSLLIHYYTAFVFIAHGLWLLIKYVSKEKSLMSNISAFPRQWLFAWLGVVVVFLPWLPTAYTQFNEIQGGFWIGPVDHTSFYSTFTKIALYIDHWRLKNWYALGALMSCIVFAIGLYKFIKNSKNSRKEINLLVAAAVLPVLIIFLLSLPPFEPVFNNRYFSLITPLLVTLFAMSFLSWSSKKGWKKYIAIVIPLTFIVGINNFYSLRAFNSDNLGQNKFAEVWDYVAENEKSGDAYISLGYYSYFDLYYYAGEAREPKMYTPQKPAQYGSTSLVYDREDLHVDNLDNIRAARVWAIYYGDDNSGVVVPEDWRQIDFISAGSNRAILYEVNSITQQSTQLSFQ